MASGETVDGVPKRRASGSSTLEMYAPGTRAWFPHSSEGWACGSLVGTRNLTGDTLTLTFKLIDSGEERVFTTTIAKLEASGYSILPPLDNPPILDGVDDLANLSYLHEPAVLSTIKRRYSQEIIYTYSGIVLIAMNPFQRVPLYSMDIMRQYSGKRRGELEPHLFAVAEEAYRNMARDGKNQSIIVSGESGAGKTQSAKYIMRYFANVADLDNPSSSGSSSQFRHRGSLIEPKDSEVHGTVSNANIEDVVLSTNPIMEAFGNAKTTRNDNSSRFGKYIEIKFHRNEKTSQVKITGAKIRTYLLERSRLIFQPTSERNYHIFYQLCAGAPAAERKVMFLESCENFFYLNQGGNGVIQGVDDAQEFIQTQKALSVIGIPVSTQWDIFKVCAAVLQIGNIQIKANRDEASIPDDDKHLDNACSLLGIDKATFKKWIVKKQITTRSEKIVTSLNANQATVGRDSVAKFIYSMLFDWIVNIVNSKLERPSGAIKEAFIGVLDIYGFEHFKKNSFEQFCINYANEKLQQEFNRHVFKLEQEEYIAEEINWSFIDFADNQPCIDMIESKMGILDLLDEESRLPSGADDSLVTKLYQRFAVPTQKFFEKPRFGQSSFVVKHYACDVSYDIEGFIEKNKDTVSDEQLAVLNASSLEFLTTVTKIEDTPKIESKPGRMGNTKKPTLGSIFKGSLISLMDTIHQTDVHYIRCIKPNEAKMAFAFEPLMVLSQLRACGVLETIRISCAGYPSRWTFADFVSRYYLLVRSHEWTKDAKSLSLAIVKKTITSEDKFQSGKTKIFFRAGMLAYLEKLRTERLRDCVVLIQKNLKRIMYQKRFLRMRKAAITIQKNVRGWIARTKYRKEREERAATIIQKYVRRFIALKKFVKIQKAVVIIQSFFRMVMARKKYMEIRYLAAVIKIQAAWRGYNARREQIRHKRRIALIQGLWRRKMAVRELKQLKVEAKSVGKLKETNYKLENKVVELSQSIQKKTKENNALTEKVSHLENALHSTKEKLSKLEANMKNASAGASAETAELKKQLSSTQETLTSMQKQNDRMTSTMKQKDDEIVALQEKLQAASDVNRTLKETQKTVVNGAPAEDPEAVAAMKKEISSLREQVSKLLAGKYKADLITETRRSETSLFSSVAERVQQVFPLTQTPSQFLSREPADPNVSRLTLSRTQRIMPDDDLESPVSGEIPEMDRSVRMLRAPEVQDEIMDALITNLRIPLPSTQSVASQQEIMFPVHLLAFLIIRQLSSKMTSHMVSTMSNVMREIQDFTIKFEDDYVSAFWLSNCHQLLCLLSTALDIDLVVAGKTQLPPFPRTPETLGALDKVRVDLDTLIGRIYQGWVKELKKRIASMIVPAVIENQSLPGYVCKQGGGIWGSWAKTSSAITISVDQLVNFLSKLNSTMKCYYLDDRICRQILTELIRVIGVSAFNHLIMRKNFCTWKRGVQIQYNVSRLEEFCTNQGIAEATLHLQQLLQAAKLLTLNKGSPQDIETIFDVCFLLNLTQIKKLLSVYHAADFDSPLSPDLLKMVANRAVMNEKSENLTLDLDVGPDTVRPHLLTLKEIDTFIPTWISLPYLQAILSSTV